MVPFVSTRPVELVRHAEEFISFRPKHGSDLQPVSAACHQGRRGHAVVTKPGRDEPERLWMGCAKISDLHPGQVHVVSARSNVPGVYACTEEGQRDMIWMLGTAEVVKRVYQCVLAMTLEGNAKVHHGASGGRT